MNSHGYYGYGGWGPPLPTLSQLQQQHWAAQQQWQQAPSQTQAKADEDQTISDTQSDCPSVGGELTPGQTQMTSIPVLEKSSSKKKKKKSKVVVKEKKRAYMVPGPQSGGVPNPSPAYIAQSAGAPSQLDVPRRILVVMDLNGTLLHRPNARKSSSFVERPYTRTFLQYCLQTFVVAIWSSAKPENVDRMVPQIVSDADRQRLVAVWGRDTLGLSVEDYNNRVQCYKRLERVWGDARVAASHPEAHLGKRWDQTNTVLIDDSKEKARSQPYNIIQLPGFEGDVNEAGYVLPQVHNYLNELAFQSDISSFIREKPFKFDPEFKLATV
ncbi:hypothetical protein KJ359_007252 [Pestalotiopsis sp. 9143b]|nr:hypothetical protein KJ359_007252 [Pestalotiopsis sp. 9143b]